MKGQPTYFDILIKCYDLIRVKKNWNFYLKIWQENGGKFSGLASASVQDER